MLLTRQSIDETLARVLTDALGSFQTTVDYDADLEDSGLDSLRLSSALLAFEDELGEELPIECIDQLAEARTLGAIRDILVQRFLVEA